MTRTLTASRPGGVTLEARIDGLIGAPWVVFSNSIMTDMRVWDAQVGALTDRFCVLRYDQRGHGASVVPDGPLCFDDYGC